MAEEIEPSSWRNYTRYQWTVLVVFGIVNMVSAMTYSTQAPFFPAEAERKNATALEYGLVIGIYELTAFIMCPLLGTYMYVIGPKTGFSVGVFVAGSSMVAFGFDKIHDRIYFIGLALLLRVMQGTGASALFVSIYSFVTEAFPNSVATTFALMETFFGFGFCIGPVVGEALFHVGGFTLPFAALGGFMMVSPFFAHFLLKKPETLATTSGSSFGGILGLIRIPTISVNVFGTFVGGFTVGFLAATLEPHIRQFKLSPPLLSLTFLTYGAVYALTGPLIGSICDRLKQPAFITLIGSALTFIAFLIIGPAPFIPFAPIVWLIWTSLVVFGLGLGAIYVSTFLLTLQDARKHDYPDSVGTYGLVSGLWMSALSLGAFIGPVVAGLLLDNYGFRIATYAILSLTAFLMLVSVVSILKRQSIVEPGINGDCRADRASLLRPTEIVWNNDNVDQTIPRQ